VQMDGAMNGQEEGKMLLAHTHNGVGDWGN
jgi:hypothetical protein